MESMRWKIHKTYLHDIEKKEKEIKMIRELLTDMEVRKQRSGLRIINAPGEREEKKRTNEIEVIIIRHR